MRYAYFALSRLLGETRVSEQALLNWLFQQPARLTFSRDCSRSRLDVRISCAISGVPRG